MRILRAALLASALLAGGEAAAQSPEASPSTGLPPGLMRFGNVVMMAPIPDSEEGRSMSQAGVERRVGLVHVLSASDHDVYEHAFDAADRGDWIAARGLADQGHDPIARLLVQWRYLLDKNSGATFAEIDEFLKNYPDWPDRDTLYARAEEAMNPATDPHAVIAWFADRQPVSDIGKIRLGDALAATGSAARGNDLIREGWIDGDFDPDQEFAVIRRDGDLLTPDVDRLRLARLIGRNDVTAAKRELARVPPDAQHIAEARIALRTSLSGGQRMIARLPDDSQNDPGIIFDRARLLGQQSDVAAIPELLTRAPVQELAEISPDRWWSELNLDARTALQSADYHSAYAIAAHNGLTPDDGTDYSEAEFMSGWIALRFLKDPTTALVHFRNLADAVSRPISRARAHYWEGRAYEAEGDLASAWQQYKIAAATPEVFYGQLALAHLSDSPVLHLKEQTIDSIALGNDFEREALTRAIRVLADLGQENFLRGFAVHDATVYDDPRHIELLAQDLVRMGFREVAVRVAKEASYSNVLLLTYSHPVIPVPAYTGPGIAPDQALVLGIIRQETEFDPAAVSPAGARGIMQVMPNDARHIANIGGLPYRPNDLTGDPAYDMKLGMTELAGHLADWGGSYVLAIAAYNAGSNNVRRWIAEFGDPRDVRVDPIDWIEEIPFSETRNYVQRVIENVEVYRNRIAGRDQKLQILADLYRPDAPQSEALRYPPVGAPSASVPLPVPRPPASANADATAADSATPAAASAATGVAAVAPLPNPQR